MANWVQPVTQWMSVTRSRCGRARNSVQVSSNAGSTSPSTMSRQSARGGTADVSRSPTTGNLWVKACPGGRRRVSSVMGPLDPGHHTRGEDPAPSRQSKWKGRSGHFFQGGPFAMPSRVPIFALATLIAFSSLRVAAAPWQLTPSPAGESVTGLAFDSQSPGVVVAGTSLDGLFRSTDGGASWQPVLNQPGSASVLAEEPGTLYAGTPGYGLYTSRDSGLNWVESLLPGGLPDQPITQSIATDPGRSGT